MWTGGRDRAPWAALAVTGQQGLSSCGLARLDQSVLTARPLRFCPVRRVLKWVSIAPIVQETGNPTRLGLAAGRDQGQEVTRLGPGRTCLPAGGGGAALEGARYHRVQRFV